MASQKIVLIGIAALVAAGGAYVVLQNSSGDAPAAGVQNAEERTTSERMAERSGFGTFGDLLASGDDITCDVSYQQDGTDARGTLYLSGEKMRGDFNIQSAGYTLESHVIHDGEYGYAWGTTPVGTMAMKFALEDEMGSGDETTSAPEEVIDYDQQVEYECESWNADQSYFVPPADITFTEMQAQMQMQGSFDGGALQDQCAACAQIPDANARAQCLSALQCN